MTRRALPARRGHELLRAVHLPGTAGTMPIEIGLGRYDDGALGEVFLDPANSGHAPLLRDVAIILSLLLQHGGTIDAVRHSITRDADGVTPCTMIGTAIDAVAEHERERT